MKKASRFLTLLLVAVLVLSIFSGCSLFGKNTEKYRSQVALTVGNEEITIGKLIDTYNSYYNTYASYIGTYVTLDSIFEMAMSSLYSQYIKIDAYKTSGNAETTQHTWLGDTKLYNQEYLNVEELQYGVKYVKYLVFSTLDTLVESYIEGDYTLADAEEEEEEDTSRDFVEFDDLEGANSYSEYTYKQTFVNEEMDEYISKYYEGILDATKLTVDEYVYNKDGKLPEALTEKIDDFNDRIEGSDPITVEKYVEYQQQALKQYQKNVEISYEYDLATLINRQLEDYISSVIVAKYNYAIYGKIDGANLNDTLAQLKAKVEDAKVSQKTDFKINSNFVDFIEGLDDDSHIYDVPDGYNYVFVKNILIPFTTEQKTVLSNLEKQLGSATNSLYIQVRNQFASQIVADDFNSTKDDDGNYQKVGNLFVLQNGKLAINPNGELGKYFKADGHVVADGDKTAEETIVDLMKRFNTDTASHSKLHDYVVRVGEVPESYETPWVQEFVDATNDAYEAAKGVAGKTYGIAISTYGVHIVFYSADVKAETFNFEENWLKTSTSEYRLFKEFFSEESDEMVEEDADALKDLYYASKITKTDAFDKFLSENEITFDFEESISLDDEEE